MDGGMADDIRILKNGDARRSACGIAPDTRERPDCIHFGCGCGIAVDECFECGDGRRAAFAKFMNGALLDKEAVIAQQFDALRWREFCPVQLESARVAQFDGADFTHAIDRAEHIGLGELRSGATDFVPAAGVHDEQAAIGVLEHIGGMKIVIVGGKKIAVAGGEGRAIGDELVAGDFAQIEITGEKVVEIIRTEKARTVGCHSAGRSCVHVSEHGHEVAGARVAVEHGMLLAINTAVDGVDETITTATGGVLKKCAAQETFASGVESDTDGIIHAAGEDRLDAGSIGSRAKDVRGAGDKGLVVVKRVALFGKRALGPVEPAIGAEIGAVQIIGAAGERLAVVPHLALVSHAIIVGVGEFPDLRRRGDIERAFVKHRALGEHHFIGEHDGLVEAPVAIGVFQAHNAVILPLILRRAFVAGTRRIRCVEPSLFIEGD